MLRHNKWEDYALEQPDSYQLIQELRKAAGEHLPMEFVLCDFLQSSGPNLL